MMIHSSHPTIQILGAENEQAALPELINLLQDTVASGASVGFLPPLSAEDAERYWRAVFQDVAQQNRILLVAYNSGHIAGSVQLAFATQANGRHRAEVQKLFVLQSQRRQGIGQALMLAIEQVAREHGRTLLVLDTRQGDTAEQLYRKVGYTEVGVIPAYAQDAAGNLQGTIFFYKLLAHPQ
jgi:ribosomal protein S18 acetylase RimI-like enzyme